MSHIESCPICGCKDHRLYLHRVYAIKEEDFDLRQCCGCGLVFVHPRPSLEVVRELYGEEYFFSDFSCGIRQGTYLETEASRVEEYRETLSRIQAFKDSGRFLEVGCAAGSFLNYTRRAGFEVEGVDISAWAARTARGQFGLTVHEGRLMEVKLPARSFDVVFLGDLLEHEPDPVAFLQEIRRVLSDDGVAVIKVPVYVNSFYYRLFRRLPWSWTMGKLDARLLQSLKVSEDEPRLPPYHLYEYSPRTLALLLNKAKFRIVRRESSLLIPEFLRQDEAGWPSRLVLAGFLFLRFLVKTLNIHGGHITVFAVKSEMSGGSEASPADG
jgi:SAM-dependent methyltransferase